MLDAFFTPESVAVVGASREPGKLGYAVINNILQYGYRGKVYPINPKADEILGLKAYPSVQAVPEPVEMAVIVVPPKAVPQVVTECGERGVKAVVVITAGFRETGPAGVAAEHQLVEIIHRYGMRMIGPNCLGVIDTATPLNASFAAGMPRRGNIAFMSQSGAICTAILDWAAVEDIGFSKFVSIGNKADVNETDLLQAWTDDAESRVVIGYLEGITNGHRFMQVARTLTRKKPLILIKSGGTSAGARAVGSHTGTLAGSDQAYDAAFLQSGVIRARSMEELFDYSIAFANQPLPAGRRIAIVTNAGGPGIIATDAVERAGMQLAGLSQETVEALRQVLPPESNLYNPIDVLGDARSDRYRLALDAALKDPGVDAALVLLTPQAVTDIENIVQVIVEFAGKSDKPVLTSFMGGERIAEGVRHLNDAGVPNYSFPERAVEALRAMAVQHEMMQTETSAPVHFEVDRARADEIINHAREDRRTALNDMEARAILEAYGLPTPRTRLARSVDEAVQFARDIGYPVVMQIISPDILHKSDIGGVRVGVNGDEEVRTAYTVIMQNARRYDPQGDIWGIAIQEMLPPGKETIIGVATDPQFGHLLLFGLGGIYVEILKDVVFRIAPVGPDEARAMVQGIRAYPLLAGVRGQAPSDMDAIVDAIERISQLVTDYPQIAELDINPLMVYPTAPVEQRPHGYGAIALDARIILAAEG